MKEYRRRLVHDTWHWVRTCALYPQANYKALMVPAGHRPATGELCNQCLAKERLGLR